MLFTGSLVSFISSDCVVVWFSSLLDGIMLGLVGFYSNCYCFVNQHNYCLGLLWSEPLGHPHFFLCSFFSSLFFFFPLKPLEYFQIFQQKKLLGEETSEQL